jgi:hypothetical protein
LASIDPFTRLADENGFLNDAAKVSWGTVVEDRLATEAENNEIDGFIDATLGVALRCGEEGVGEPVIAVVDAGSPWFDTSRYVINAGWCSDPADVPTLDIARYRDPGEN